MLPVLENGPYSFVVNKVIEHSGNQTSFCKELMLEIKKTLVSLGWTVIGSSNGTVGAGKNGTPDLWLTTSDLNWGTETQSWIVLENAAGALFGISLSKADVTQCVMYAYHQSSSMKAMLETAEQPTTYIDASLDNAFLNGSWIPDASEMGNVSLHGMAGIGGYQRVVLQKEVDGKNAVAVYGFEKIKNQHDCLGTEPFAVHCPVNTYDGTPEGGPTRYDAAFGAVYFKVVTSTGIVDHLATGEATKDGLVAADVNGNPRLSGEYAITPIGIFSTVSGYKGINGALMDLWWGSKAHKTGDTYPGDGSRTLVKVGECFVMPWNGEQPRLSDG